ncbi:hypothetical protein DEI81_10345 [Curtobacterium sp. MCBD17_013]|uniref:hypothetical protein n=1 Tax=unclassified Curtobacterium TaxID=257496 RepID=UPI000DAA5981|nr:MULTISPECIES: hypothetical protein [unclassified Curtobacterium]PZF61791.1 hypothetical protein DEI81_10345 [Curtobacterium sp. MCBD17_013]WIB63371.1 hypothetical protein DEI94_14670 [Curtobacterium sp. MCBD17_040]
MTIAAHPVRVLRAIARPDGAWWTVELPELTSPSPLGGEPIIALGQVERDGDVAAAALDIAAVWLDVDESTLEVRVEFGRPLTGD